MWVSRAPPRKIQPAFPGPNDSVQIRWLKSLASVKGDCPRLQDLLMSHPQATKYSKHSENLSYIVTER